MTGAALAELLSNLAKLGASPAVQQLVLGWIAPHMPQGELDKAIAAMKEPPDPKRQ